MNGVLNQEMSSMLANSINHYESIQHQEKMNLLISEQELLLVKTFGLKPYLDGDQWCVILGDIPTGICGFGESPMKAIYDFNKSFYQSNQNKQI